MDMTKEELNKAIENLVSLIDKKGLKEGGERVSIRLPEGSSR